MKRLTFRFLVLAACAAASLASQAASPHRVVGSNPGGASPNVVQAFAEERCLIRSTSNPKCEALFERVKNIARGAVTPRYNAKIK